MSNRTTINLFELADSVEAAAALRSKEAPVGIPYHADRAHWLRVMYEAIAELPTIKELRDPDNDLDRWWDRMPTLRVWDGDFEEGLAGRYRIDTFEIDVAAEANPWDALGTLVHEVAHALSPGRVAHGGAWRAAFAQLMHEFVGTNLLEGAAEARARFRNGGRRFGLQASLDVACVVALADARPFFLSTGTGYDVYAGGKIIHVGDPYGC